MEEYLADRYHGWYAPDSVEEVPYNRSEAIAGMRASVDALRGARVRTPNRVVALRGENEAVAGYEKVIERDGTTVASAVIVEAWRHDGERWLLERELTEHGASVAEPS